MASAMRDYRIHNKKYQKMGIVCDYKNILFHTQVKEILMLHFL